MNDKVEAAKVILRANECKDINSDIDDDVAYNCLYYHLSPKCFSETFGPRGIELGEIVKTDTQTKFNNCWKESDDGYLYSGD